MHNTIERTSNENVKSNNYFDSFYELMKNQLNEMIDNDGKKLKNKHHINKIFISKPGIDKYYIDKYISFEYTFKEIPSHSIILANIPVETTDEDIKYIANQFGDFEKINFEELSKGRIEIIFYNIKDSMFMRASKIFINNYSIMTSFGKDISVIDKKNPPNNGTIVVFNLPSHVSDAEICHIFKEFGEIKDIRVTPNKKTQRFIEFYDLRDACNAKNSMKKKKMIISGKSCNLNVEFSLPGNYRNNYQNIYNHTIPTIQRRVISKLN